MYVFVWSAVLTLSKFLCRFGDEMSDCFPYRAKAMFAFEEIDGVDVCFFGMHVQEYGSNCPMPNTRWVKLTFLWTECMIMWTVRISIFSDCNADCRIGVIVLSSLVIRIRQSCDHVFVCVDCLLTLLDHVIRMCELSAHKIRSCHLSVCCLLTLLDHVVIVRISFLRFYFIVVLPHSHSDSHDHGSDKCFIMPIL